MRARKKLLRRSLLNSRKTVMPITPDNRDYSSAMPIQPERHDVRSIEFLTQALLLPNGLRIEKRPTNRKDGSAGYALVSTVAGAEIVTFELGIFFSNNFIPNLQKAINDALSRFDSTQQTQRASFYDPSND